MPKEEEEKNDFRSVPFIAVVRLGIPLEQIQNHKGIYYYPAAECFYVQKGTGADTWLKLLGL